MDINALVGKLGEWLRSTGPQSDIVMSSRIRLARNLADFPFMTRASEQDRAEIDRTLRDHLQKLELEGELHALDVSKLSMLDRQFLVERQLISREHADGSGARSVVFDDREQISLMINEEDHLRIQVMHSGLDLNTCWEQINAVDDQIERHVRYAFNDKLGYLTACPTNVGTGMRVSVLLHLPALVLTKQIDKLFRSLQKIHLAVRGLYGEGSQAMGDFYQISNQITLGRKETDLVRQVGDVVPEIIRYEREARAALIKESPDALHDRVSRAFGTLRSAQTMSTEETMHLLSSVRMGINLQLISGLDVATINRVFINTQPAHLQKIKGAALETANRNVERARYLRQHLEPGGGSAAAGKN